MAKSTAVDRAVLTFFPAPHSYTGEDVLEISAHGSRVLLHAIVDAAIQAGARLAEPGEFTFRAYLRGRIDLVQAEAVRDLVDAITPLQARAAFDQLEGTLTGRIREIDAALFEVSARLEASLDFADEGYHFIDPERAALEIEEIGRSIDDCSQTPDADAWCARARRSSSSAGRTPASQASSTASLAPARAIVTDIPGTTRDLLTEVLDLDGIAVTLVDTAGLRGARADAVEQEGIARAHAARTVCRPDRRRARCDRVRSRRTTRNCSRTRARAAASSSANKSDLAVAWDPRARGGADVAGVGAHRCRIRSAACGDGRRALRRRGLRDTPAVTNLRHVELLASARASLRRARPRRRRERPRNSSPPT